MGGLVVVTHCRRNKISVICKVSLSKALEICFDRQEIQ